MRLLLDECVPRPLKKEFTGHLVATIEQAGLKGLENGDLLRVAAANFDILVTVDKNIEYQQNPANLPMAVLIISARSNRLEDLIPMMSKVLDAIDVIKLGEVIKVE